MASDSYEGGSKKIRPKALEKRQHPPASRSAPEGPTGAQVAKRNRACERQSVPYASLSKAKSSLRETGGAGESDRLRRESPGLDPREAIIQWLQFAKAHNYHRVTGVRQFDTHLEKVDTIAEEENSLFKFCRERGSASLEKWQALNEGPKKHEGVEHRVFYSLRDDPPRATKITFPGKYGRIEHTVFLYMERLALFNELFPGLDIRFEDCVSDGKGSYMIVSSMLVFSGGHPTLGEIDAFLRDRGFVTYSDGSTTIDYRSVELGVIVRDCHPRNWIKAKDGTLIPIDIGPELF